MNAWSYLAGTPFGAVVLVLAVGWSFAGIVRAWRERRPVRVRLMLRCPDCGREADAVESRYEPIEVQG